MDKQLTKLFCEVLKKRYEHEFKKFNGMDIVIADLLRSEAEFLRELHKNLKEKLNKADLDHPDTLLYKLANIEDDGNALISSYKEKIEKIRLEKDNKVGQERTKALVLAEKLTLVEAKLNTLGVTVHIEDGKIIFKDTNEPKE